MNTVVPKMQIKLSPFVPCLGGFIILLFLRDYVEMSIPSILFLCLTLLIAALAEKTEIIAFCFSCIPMLNAFQSKYALLICMVLYAIRFAKKSTIHLHILPIGFLVVWELLHGFVGDFSIVEILRLFTELFFCCFIMCLSVEDFDFKKIIRSMSVIAICVCVIILLSHLKLNNYQVDVLFSGAFRLGYGVDETKMSVGFNPNYLAYICLCCIEGLAFIIYKKQHNYLDIILITLLGVCGLLTMSKKFILCALAFLVLFLLSKKRMVRSLMFIAIVLVLVVIVFKNVFPAAYDTLIMRFEEDDLSTGRNDIFSFFNEQLYTDLNLLLFGVGLQGYETTLLTRYDSSIPHNGFQELLVMWGIPGLIIFVAFLILVILRANKINPRIKFINYVPFLVMLLNVQVSQMVSSSVVNMLLSVVYVCLITDMNEPEECEKLNGISNIGDEQCLQMKID